MSKQINLFHKSLLETKPFITLKNLAFICLAILPLLGVASSYFQYQSQQLKNKETELLVILNQQQSQMRTLREQLSGQSENPHYKNDVEALLKNIDAYQNILSYLSGDDLGNLQGHSPYFVAFAKHTPPRVWLTGFEIDYARELLLIRGRTYQEELIPQMLTALKKEKIFEGTRFSKVILKRPKLNDKEVHQSESKEVNKADSFTSGTQDASYIEFEIQTQRKTDAKMPHSSEQTKPSD